MWLLRTISIMSVLMIPILGSGLEPETPVGACPSSWCTVISAPKPPLDERDLYEAAKRGNLTYVNKALDSGINAHWRNPGWPYNMKTVLHAAAWTNHPASVRALLAAGSGKDLRDDRGLTPLFVASYKGNTNVATMLIDQGADINIPGYAGETPLMTASARGHKRIVEKLLAANANVRLKEKLKGGTALHAAAWNNNADIVQLLLDADAERWGQDNDGNPPAEYAKRRGYLELADTLDSLISSLKYIDHNEHVHTFLGDLDNLRLSKDEKEFYL